MITPFLTQKYLFIPPYFSVHVRFSIIYNKRIFGAVNYLMLYLKYNSRPKPKTSLKKITRNISMYDIICIMYIRYNVHGIPHRSGKTLEECSLSDDVETISIYMCAYSRCYYLIQIFNWKCVCCSRKYISNNNTHIQIWEALLKCSSSCPSNSTYRLIYYFLYGDSFVN